MRAKGVVTLLFFSFVLIGVLLLILGVISFDSILAFLNDKWAVLKGVFR